MKNKSTILLLEDWPLSRLQWWFYILLSQLIGLVVICIIDGFDRSSLWNILYIPFVSILASWLIKYLGEVPDLNINDGMIVLSSRNKKENFSISIDNQSNFYLDKGFWGKKIVFNQDGRNTEIYLFSFFKKKLKEHIDESGDKSKFSKIYELLV